MILRVYTTCPGCDQPTMLRIGVAVEPGERQPFSVNCRQCDSMIRGRLLTTKEADVSVELDEGSELAEGSFDDWQVITTHPAFPFVPGTVRSPFLDVTVALGDYTPAYFKAIGQFNYTAAHEWPQLERAYQFYLTQQWDLFDTALSRLMPDSWPREPDTLDRHDVVNRLLTVTIAILDPSTIYLDMHREIWERAEPSPQLLEYMCSASTQAQVIAFQRRLLRQVSRMIEIRDLWMPALPSIWLSRLNQEIPNEWRLPGSNFSTLRGDYQQNFELSCQALPMLVAIQNAAEKRPATIIREDSSDSEWIPAALPIDKAPVRTIAQFLRLNAEAKEIYLDRYPVTESYWQGAFDRQIRNAISHADADEVIATGTITTGKGASLPYLQFVECIAEQLQLLLLWLNLCRLFRVHVLLAERRINSP